MRSARPTNTPSSSYFFIAPIQQRLIGNFSSLYHLDTLYLVVVWCCFVQSCFRCLWHILLFLVVHHSYRGFSPSLLRCCCLNARRHTITVCILEFEGRLRKWRIFNRRSSSATRSGVEIVSLEAKQRRTRPVCFTSPIPRKTYDNNNSESISGNV